MTDWENADHFAGLMVEWFAGTEYEATRQEYHDWCFRGVELGDDPADVHASWIDQHRHDAEDAEWERQREADELAAAAEEQAEYDRELDAEWDTILADAARRHADEGGDA